MESMQLPGAQPHRVPYVEPRIVDQAPMMEPFSGQTPLVLPPRANSSQIMILPEVEGSSESLEAALFSIPAKQLIRYAYMDSTPILSCDGNLLGFEKATNDTTTVHHIIPHELYKRESVEVPEDIKPYLRFLNGHQNDILNGAPITIALHNELHLIDNQDILFTYKRLTKTLLMCSALHIYEVINSVHPEDKKFYQICVPISKVRHEISERARAANKYVRQSHPGFAKKFDNMVWEFNNVEF